MKWSSVKELLKLTANPFPLPHQALILDYTRHQNRATGEEWTTSRGTSSYKGSHFNKANKQSSRNVSNTAQIFALLANIFRFRWVACQLDFICDLTSDDECCKALDLPAPSLDEIYERLLLRVQTKPKTTQDLVKSALNWILFSAHPLEINALCEAVMIRIGSEKKPVPTTLSQIRRFCSSLIRESADGKILEVAYFTVKEFFNSINKESHPHISRFCLSEEEAYLEFSKVSLTYFNFNDFHKTIPPTSELIEVLGPPHPFYCRAALKWAEYASNRWNDATVLLLAKRLFHPQCQLDSNYGAIAFSLSFSVLVFSFCLGG